MSPKHMYRAILAIGIIEILIGMLTFSGCFIAQAWGWWGFTQKPASMYIFVITGASLSLVLGVGILANRRWARELLVFFSGYIVLTKILIYLHLLTFTHHIFTIVPVWLKDVLSFFYHSVVIITLWPGRVKRTEWHE